jgi:glutathione reductase (NADPH)
MLNNAGVKVIDGRGRIIDPHTVEVAGKHYSAERILIAVGGWPVIPAIEGGEHIISSNEVFYLKEFPKRVIVVGGGYIAVEFAGIFDGLGSETHLLYRGELFLRGFDKDIREFVANEMTKKGVNLKFNTNVTAITKQEDGTLLVSLTDGSTLEVDCVMYATGRKPKTEDIGLENTKVECNANGAIVVNEDYQTNEPSIYGLGDATDRVQLTPVALAEGMALVRNLYGGANQKVDYNFIATAVFSNPNIGTVGYSEEDAVAKYEKIAVYKAEFKHMKHTLGGSDERTFMKLLVDQKTDKVIGCHMVGSDAGEIIQGIAIAIKAGATKNDFDTTIGIHPTAAEEFVTMREPAYILG